MDPGEGRVTISSPAALRLGDGRSALSHIGKLRETRSSCLRIDAAMAADYLSSVENKGACAVTPIGSFSCGERYRTGEGSLAPRPHRIPRE